MKVNIYSLVPSFALIKTDLYVYLFLTVTIDFITNLPESNGYNALYIVVDHDLTKTIVLISCVSD